MALYHGNINETILGNKFVPIRQINPVTGEFETQEGRYKHKYYSNTPIWYKTYNDNKWYRATGLLTGHSPFPLDFNKESEPDPNKNEYGKYIESFRFLNESYGDLRADMDNSEVLEYARLVYVPYIRASSLELGVDIARSCETLIFNGGMTSIHTPPFSDSVSPESNPTYTLKNVWSYGKLSWFHSHPYRLENVRVPYNIIQINCTSGVNIVGLDQLVNNNKYLSVRLDRIDDGTHINPYRGGIVEEP